LTVYNKTKNISNYESKCIDEKLLQKIQKTKGLVDNIQHIHALYLPYEKM